MSTTKHQQISVYLPHELVERFKRVAKTNHRSMNAELTMIIEQHVAQQQKEKQSNEPTIASH